MLVIALQYINVSNQHVVQPKLEQCYTAIISQYSWKKGEIKAEEMTGRTVFTHYSFPGHWWSQIGNLVFFFIQITSPSFPNIQKSKNFFKRKYSQIFKKKTLCLNFYHFSYSRSYNSYSNIVAIILLFSGINNRRNHMESIITYLEITYVWTCNNFPFASFA